MKSMDSTYRAKVNQYIMFLRWQIRREEAEAEADIELETSSDSALE